MAPLVYVMAILGCGDDGAACTRERVAPVSYQSIAECQAAMPAILVSNSDLSFPVISASCERGGRFVVDNAKPTKPAAG